MKKCAIIVNGFYTNPSIEHQVASLKRELEARGVVCTVVKGNELLAHVEDCNAVTWLDVDFAVYLDKDVHTARLLERSGIRLFNSASAIELCDDKMLTYIALTGKGVRMPKTVSSPVMYRPVSEDGTFLNRVEQEIGYPTVVKEVFGSMGYGVHLAVNRDELDALRQRFKLVPHLYQQFIGRGGEDKRVILVGGEVVACMLRKNYGDFRSNIEHGGKGYVTELTDEEKDIATAAARELGLDYCGVDILTGLDGKPYFCEANSNAFFRGIEAVTGVSVAGKYADFMLCSLTE